jgi:hypothetical protein
MYVYVYFHVCVWMRIYICIWVCIYMYVLCVCECIYAYVFVWICAYMCMDVCVYIYIYVSVTYIQWWLLTPFGIHDFRLPVAGLIPLRRFDLCLCFSQCPITRPTACLNINTRTSAIVKAKAWIRLQRQEENHLWLKADSFLVKAEFKSCI